MTEKAFVYHGKVESITRQMEEYQDRINQKYLDIFGEQNYKKLAQASAALLTPESFMNSQEELEKMSRVKFAPNQCSKLILLVDSDFSLNPDKTFKQKKIRIAPGFYVSDQSFRFSGASKYSENIIGTYVHEFNHFAWLILQKTPLYIVESALARERGHPVRERRDVEDLINGLEMDARPVQQKRELIASSLGAYMVHEGFEQINRILDCNVLKSIGIETSIPFRRQKKKFVPGHSPASQMAFMFPAGGDYFWNMDDKEAIRKFLNWEKHFTMITNASFIPKIIDSVKSLDIKLLSLGALNKERES